MMIMMSLVYSSFTPQGYVNVHAERKEPKTSHQENPPTPACAVRRARGMGPSLKGKRKERKERYIVPYWATLSSASHAIHPSIFVARVSSASSPSINLTTPDSSRKRSKRLSHRGLLRSTRMPPGLCLPTPLPAPRVGCRSCSAARCETESFSARGRTSIGHPRAS